MSADLRLTEREERVAAACAARNAGRLRAVIVGLTIALMISLGGSTLGWYLTRAESVKRTDAINDSRRQVLVENCQETNTRNRQTLSKLDEVAPKNPTPRQLQSLQSTKLLIAALVPLRVDCVAYAEERLGGPDSPL